METNNTTYVSKPVTLSKSPLSPFYFIGCVHNHQRQGRLDGLVCLIQKVIGKRRSLDKGRLFDKGRLTEREAFTPKSLFKGAFIRELPFIRSFIVISPNPMQRREWTRRVRCKRGSISPNHYGGLLV